MEHKLKSKVNVTEKEDDQVVDINMKEYSKKKSFSKLYKKYIFCLNIIDWK